MKHSKSIMQQYTVEWSTLIQTQIKFDNPNGIEYLEKIEEYCTAGGYPKGIYTAVFQFAQDPEFIRLLDDCQRNTEISKQFIPELFTQTKLQDSVKDFNTDIPKLYADLKDAAFQLIPSSSIERKLSEYLYHYGIYRRFKNDYTLEKATEITRDFTGILFNRKPEDVICFSTTLPWGYWFDRNSCSDLSLVVVNKKENMIWLFAFSHSD